MKQEHLSMGRCKMENVGVGGIFREAGTALNKLSEMTMMLQPLADTQHGGKWTDEEIAILRSYVHRFAVDFKFGHHIKSRIVSQRRSTLKKKSFEDFSIPVRQVCSITPVVVKPATHSVSPLSIIQGVLRTNAEVTNVLNAAENEVNGEGSTGDVKLRVRWNRRGSGHMLHFDSWFPFPLNRFWLVT